MFVFMYFNFGYELVFSILIKITYIAADYVDLKANAEDPIYLGKKDSPDFNIKMPQKQALPSSTQVSYYSFYVLL